jgi:hypothetical protein
MTRREYDRYATTAGVTMALLKSVHIAGTVLEPCSGESDMVDVLHMSPFISRVITNDIDPNMKADFYSDITNIGSPIWGDEIAGISDYMVTNPPFNDAAPILRNAYQCGNIKRVALLLRLSFLEPTTGDQKWHGRKYLLQELGDHLSHLLIFGSPRPSFTGNNRTDSVATAWFVWEFDKITKTKISYLHNWQLDQVATMDFVAKNALSGRKIK